MIKDLILLLNFIQIYKRTSHNASKQLYILDYVVKIYNFLHKHCAIKINKSYFFISNRRL